MLPERVDKGVWPTYLSGEPVGFRALGTIRVFGIPNKAYTGQSRAGLESAAIA